jgi:hypothetical protein
MTLSLLRHSSIASISYTAHDTVGLGVLNSNSVRNGYVLRS